MQLKTKEHGEVMEQFERQFVGLRFDREAKDLWPRGAVYQDGQTNELFKAFRQGVAFGKMLAK